MLNDSKFEIFFFLKIFQKIGDKKICCIECSKYRKLINSKTSYFLDKTLLISIISD